MCILAYFEIFRNLNCTNEFVFEAIYFRAFVVLWSLFGKAFKTDDVSEQLYLNDLANSIQVRCFVLGKYIFFVCGIE